VFAFVPACLVSILQLQLRFHGRVVVAFLALEDYRCSAYVAVVFGSFFVLAAETLAMPDL